MRSAIGFALLLIAAVAHAEDLERARAYFQAGVAAYDEGKHETALREFQHAHALSHNPELYFNMAACEEHLNHYQAAALLLRQYVIEKPDAEDRPNVEARIQALEKREESIHRLPDAAAAPPLPAVAPTAPAAVVIATPAPVPLRRRYLGGFIALGATGLFGLAAIGPGAWALSDHSALQSSCGTTRSCSAAQVDGYRSAALATDVLIGLTAAAAITAVVLFVLESRHPAARARLADARGWAF